MNPIKVAIVIGETFNGGVGVEMLNYFRHLDHSRFVIDFLVNKLPAENVRAEVESFGGKILPIPSRKNIIRYIFALSRIFKRGKYDIVHSNLTTLNIFPLFAARLAGVKRRLAHCHSASNPADRLAHRIKSAIRPFSRMFATEYLTCSLEAGTWLFGKRLMASGKVKLIRNAIELDRFEFNAEKREKLRKELKLEGKFVIGHVGRVSAQKNHAFIVKCFDEALKLNPEARLLLVGNGELYWEIKVQVALLGLADKVIFTGNIPDVADYYNVMDVFLFPSLFEGLSVVLVEAQANGLPCLISTNNSAESKITDLVDFLPLSDTAANWAKKCVSLSRGELDNEARLRAAGYDIRAAAKGIAEVYG